jgi:hypothetical protein
LPCLKDGGAVEQRPLHDERQPDDGDAAEHPRPVFDHLRQRCLRVSLERCGVEQVAAGVPGEVHLGEHGEVDGLPFGLSEQFERAVGVERAVRDLQLRTARSDAEEAVSVHGVK